MSAKNSAYKGYEIVSYEARMTAKMWFEVAVICLALQGILFVIIASKIVPELSLELFWKLQVARFARGVFWNPIFTVLGKHVTASNLLQLDIAHRIASQAIPKVTLAFMASCGAYAAYLPLLAFFKRKATEATETKHIRGMQLVSEEQLAAAVKKEKGILPFGSVVLPGKYEPEHVMIAGKTRVGKSVCLTQHLDAIRSSALPAILYDFKGEYLERFYREGIDHIANPLDQRGIKWNLFDDIQTLPDVSAVVGSLIPSTTGEDRFWSSAAQDVLRGVIVALHVQGKRKHADLWKALTMPIKDIAALCATTPSGAAGHQYIASDNKKADSVISVLMSYVSWLEFAQNGSGFSIRKWLEDPGESTLFITGRPEVENTLKPYISLLIDLMGKRFLSMTDDRNRRLYFLLDEFGNMQKLPTIKRLLTAGGSKGATVILGFQDFAAIVKAYGREDAETILNSCGTSYVLKSADEATAKIFSGRFGDVQYWDTSETSSMGPADTKDGLSLVRNRVTEKLILPSQIQCLPKLAGYLLLPENNPALVNLSIKGPNKLPAINEAFIPCAGISLDDVEARENAIEAKKNLAIGLPIEAPKAEDQVKGAPAEETEDKPSSPPRILGDDLDL